MVAKIGDYEISEKDGNILCTCRWSSIYPENYKDGKGICRHIKQYIKEIQDEKKKRLE